MPKYFQYGQKYYTQGDRNTLQEISEQDIIGRRGTGGSLDLVRKEGDIMDIDPSKIALTPNTEWSGVKPGEYTSTNLPGIIFRNQAELKALGLTPPSDVPETGALGAGLGVNQDFADYLKETGQTFTNGQFSGTGARPGGLPPAVLGQPQGPQQATVLTPSQSTNANNTLYKQWNGSNWDVFNADGTPMKDIKRFESGELNIDHINTKQVLGSRTPGKVEADKTFSDGATTTGMFGGEQDDFFKTLKDRLAKQDEMIAELIAAGEKSEERKKLEKTADDLTSSYEQGLTDIYGKTISMDAITGQAAQLERRANDRLNAINRTLERLEGNEEATQKTLEKAYNLTRQSTQDAIAFWQLTQPDKLWVDTDNGKVYFENPLTGEITSKDLPGFTPKTPSSVEEYNYLVDNELIPSGTSYLEYQKMKATQFGTEGGGVTPGTPTGSTSQFTAANYANRVEQSNNIFDVVSSDLSQLGTVEFGIQKRLPNALKSSTMRQYEQASRNFINAVLRRESGAAIAESEFTSAEKQYLPQPGDDQQTLLQKQLNRQLVQRNFINEAGTAYAPTSLTNPPSQQKQPPGTTIKSGNTLYQVGADGETLTAIGSAQ